MPKPSKKESRLKANTFIILFQSSDLSEVTEVKEHFRLKMTLTETIELKIAGEGENIAEEAFVDDTSEDTLFDDFDRTVIRHPNDVKQEVVEPEVVDIADDEEVDEMIGAFETQEEVSPFEANRN